ncbi:hypothetical protein ACHQM5_018022 [Ranunculus cassubicifolius]
MEKNEEDRLSDLPDVLIHRIFSFLDMTEVVSTSLLSNKWRYFWRSTPILNFDLTSWVNRGGLAGSPGCYSKEFLEKFKSFLNFVDKVLILGGNSHIQKFDLCGSDIFFNAPRLKSWVIRALERHVKQICIDMEDFSLGKPLDLPANLFASNLRDLKLYFTHHITRPIARVRLPSSLSTAGRIETLELHTILFPQGDATGELVLSCPLLKNLKIIQCNVTYLKVLNISTPLLESLELSGVSVDKDSFCTVKMVTPNLKSFNVRSFCWPGSEFTVDYSMEDVSSLIHAHIDSYLDEENVYNKRCSKGLSEILSKVYKVQYLQLSLCSIKLLTDFPELFQQLPDLYPNLKQLMLMSPLPLMALPIHAVFNILKRLPCLEKLLLQSISELWLQTYTEEDLALNAPHHNLFSCLKTFEIQNFQGLEVEMMFLQSVLERATLLEKMAIQTRTSVISDEEFQEFREKLLSVPRASSSSSISFLLEDDEA